MTNSDLRCFYCMGCGDAFALDDRATACPDCRSEAPIFRRAEEWIRELWAKQCNGLCSIDADEFRKGLMEAFERGLTDPITTERKC